MSVGVKLHDDLNIYSCYKKINNNKSNWNASSLHGIQCVSWKMAIIINVIPETL